MLIKTAEIKIITIAISLAAVFFASGCMSLLPQSRQITRSPWKTFEEAKTSFDGIIPHKTTVEELKKAGFDPYSTPNIRILTYLDIVQRFMANPSIKKEDLDEGIQTCLEFKLACMAYEAAPQSINSKRYGNFWLDILNFKRKSKATGWKFNAFIVMVDGTVVYKLWGGNPLVDEDTERRNPLGPLQEPEDLVRDAIRALYED